jgi:hypothetical protein
MRDHNLKLQMKYMLANYKSTQLHVRFILLLLCKQKIYTLLVANNLSTYWHIVDLIKLSIHVVTLVFLTEKPAPNPLCNYAQIAYEKSQLGANRHCSL